MFNEVKTHLEANKQQDVELTDGMIDWLFDHYTTTGTTASGSTITVRRWQKHGKDRLYISADGFDYAYIDRASRTFVRTFGTAKASRAGEGFLAACWPEPTPEPEDEAETHEALNYDVFDLKSVATADAYVVCEIDEAEDYLINRGSMPVYLRRIDASDKKAVAQAVLDDHDIYVDAPRGKMSTGYRLLEIDGSPAVDEWANRDMWVEQSLDLYLGCSGQTPDHFVMTVSEVADKYGIAETTIRSTIAQGYMPGAGWRKSGKTILIQANAAAARWGAK